MIKIGLNLKHNHAGCHFKSLQLIPMFSRTSITPRRFSASITGKWRRSSRFTYTPTGTRIRITKHQGSSRGSTRAKVISSRILERVSFERMIRSERISSLYRFLATKCEGRYRQCFLLHLYFVGVYSFFYACERYSGDGVFC